MKAKHSEDGFSLDGCTTREDIANRRDMIRNVARHQGRARFTDEDLYAWRSYTWWRPFVVGRARRYKPRLLGGFGNQCSQRHVRRAAAFRVTNRDRLLCSSSVLRHFFATPIPFGSISDRIDGAALDAAMAHDERPKSADIHTLIRLSTRRA